MILYQVDWNTVARDLGISNGHAARMRYSRFKGQIDPSRAKKKTPKKGEKGDLKGDMTMQMQPGMSMPTPPQMSFHLMNPGQVPKAEPMDSHCQPSPFVKSEPGHRVPREGNFAHGSEEQHHLSYPVSSGNMAPPPHMPQYVPNGLPFSMAPPLPNATQFSSPTSFGPYPTVPISQDFHMDEFGMHSPFLNNTPMINTAPTIAWEPTSAPRREQTPVEPRSESTPVSVKEEPETAQSQIDIAIPIKVEKSAQKE